MGMAAGAGLGGIGVGTAMNAIGQHQGTSAMGRVWDRQRRQQAGFDDQLAAAQDRLISGVSPTAALGTAEAAAEREAMDTGSQNLVASVRRVGDRRRGGARGGAEARATSARAGQMTLAEALSGNRLASIIAGLRRGGQRMDLLGRTYAGDAGRIRGDANRMARLAEMQEQAAGMQGSELRQIGSLFNTLGQAGVMYGMSQPAAAGEAPAATPGHDPADYTATAGHLPAHYRR